ncbi:hypothetical protein V1525DRAFT_403035 [Lipomyces kononenkoae]|uniref:Uncharacterized protein n=1 Tax=Lipomyces kononenkoae TaxID=34357 RepID=A0ACC3T1P1_LIPKO
MVPREVIPSADRLFMIYGRNIPKTPLHICLAHTRSRWLDLSTTSTHARRIPWSPEFGRSDKQFTTVPDIVPSDSTYCMDKNALFDYAKAFHLLKSNPPEQRLDVRMPYAIYMKLEKHWSNFKAEMDVRENQRYPRLAYNSLEQEVTVITAQSALHEVAASELKRNITDTFKEYFSIHKLEAREGIKDTASTTMTSTRREYFRSSKDPDGSFSYDDDEDGPILRVAIEAGFTENYRGLQRDKNMWIKGLGAKVVVLIFLQESPRFKNPNSEYNDIDIEHIDGELERMQRYMRDARRRNQERGIYGPIEYRNHTWFGNLKQARIEVWRGDMQEPVTSYLIKDGCTYDRLPTTFGLKISDFFTDRIWRSANIPDSDIYFEGEKFLRALTFGIYETALIRCTNFILPASV